METLERLGMCSIYRDLVDWTFEGRLFYKVLKLSPAGKSRSFEERRLFRW